MICRHMLNKILPRSSQLFSFKNISPQSTIFHLTNNIDSFRQSQQFLSITKYRFSTSKKQDQKTNSNHQFNEKSSYFEILGVSPNASEQQIKSAYLQMVKKYHPDLSKQPNASQKFQLIQKAYQVLSDPQQRGKIKSQLNITNPQVYQAANQFKQKFKSFKRKDTVPDQWQFSYKLYKKHYEEVDAKEKEYKKFVGQGDQYWVHKDQMQPKKIVYFQQFAMIAGSVAIAAGALYYVNQQ